MFDEFKNFFKKYDKKDLYEKIEKEGKIKEKYEIIAKRKKELDKNFEKNEIKIFLNNVREKYKDYCEKMKDYDIKLIIVIIILEMFHILLIILKKNLIL